MQQSNARFLKIWLGMVVAAALIVMLFGILVDPYLIFGTPRIDGFNARKPAVMKFERMMKAYDVVRAEPKSLILGSSSADLGIAANYAGWPAKMRPVYNLSIMGSDLHSYHRYLQHVLSHQRLSVVVIALDVDQFLIPKVHRARAVADYESRLAVRIDGSRNTEQEKQHGLDVIDMLSMNSLTSGLETLGLNWGMGSNDVDIEGGHVAVRSTPDRPDTAGSLPVFTAHEINIIGGMSTFSTQLDPEQLQLLRQILELCQSQGIQTILLLNPAHADILEIFDRLGVWPVWEEWKRALTEIAAKHSGGPIPLWDFSGYNRFSMESVEGERYLLKSYWEAVHYRPVVGNAIVDRIVGGGSEDFGVRLTPENIEMHLAAVRDQRRLYRESHPADVQRVNTLYERVVKRH